jgi:AcrR family transcriptional regulator
MTDGIARIRKPRSGAARARGTPGAVPRRRHRSGGGYARGEQTRRRILETAIELFGQSGYERASTRAIARRARVSLPALQYYFGGKEGLYRACAQYVTEDVRARLMPAAAHARHALADGKRTRAELLELLRALIEPFLEGLATDRPESWAIFFTRAQGEQAGAFEAVFEPIRITLTTLVTDLISRLLGLPLRSPEVTLRAVSIIGQAALLRRARPIILKALGWPDFDGERLAILKEVLWKSFEASLRGS